MSNEPNPILTSPIDSDWFLRRLVQIVNEGQLTFGVTLNVGGALVSGTLISGREYFQDFADKLAASFDDADLAAQVHEAIAQLGGIYDREPAPEDQLPSYIHLRDVRFHDPAGAALPDHDGVCWRGRVDAVQGFLLGRVGPSEGG